MNNKNKIFYNNKKKRFTWFMRQAGRYLPEYQKIRSQHKDFLSLCYNSQAATEVTLQPLRRFDLDAAIIFSDILVILDALGCQVSFEKGEGPKIKTEIDKLIKENYKKDLEDKIESKLYPSYQAIREVKKELPRQKSLIGFSGALWTLFAYLIEGQGSKNFSLPKEFFFQEPEKFKKIEEILIEAIAIHLKNQIKAGCNIIQIFDSWAGILAHSQKKDLIINPTKKILSKIKEETKETTIICFPRGIGECYKEFCLLDFDILSLDYTTDINHSKEIYQKYHKGTQGNIDPSLLLSKDQGPMLKEAQNILEKTKEVPHIFNLGHGILPNTPIENVETLVNFIKSY